MAKVHYIETSGDHGCLPDHCDVSFSYDDCVESLAQLFELGKGRQAELKKNGYLELRSNRDGAEYCEIVECPCSTPWIHSDGMTRAEFEREHSDDLNA